MQTKLKANSMQRKRHSIVKLSLVTSSWCGGNNDDDDMNTVRRPGLVCLFRCCYEREKRELRKERHTIVHVPQKKASMGRTRESNYCP